MKLQQFFNLTIDANDEARHRRLLVIILITVDLAFAIYSLGLLIVFPRYLERLYLVGAGVPILAGIHLLVQRRQVRLAEIVLVWLLWLLSTISAFMNGGVYAPTFYTYIIPVLLASLLIERWAGMLFALASALMGLLMIWYNQQGGPHLPLPAPLLSWLIGSLLFSVAAIVQYLAVSNLSEALTRARLNEQALQARTRQLEEREQALQQSETHLRALVQALPDALIRVRADGMITDAKLPCNFRLSQPVQQMIGRTVHESFPPELAEQLLQMNQQALLTQTIQVHEYITPIGEESRWHESRVFAIGANEVVALVRDITKRKRAIEILHQSEERYRKLVELSPDAIILYRAQRVLFANPASLELWGAHELGELIDKPLRDLIHPLDQLSIQTWEELLLERGEVIPNAAQKIVRFDGTVVDVEVAAVAYEDLDGVAVQAIYRDITERKQAEEKNQQLLAQVEAQSCQLRALNLRLANMEESERKRLTHELHDRVAQNLTGLNLNLNVLARYIRDELPSESRAHTRLADAITLVEQTTVQIRKVMADLRPPVLDDYGLLASLEWYAAQISATSGLAVEVLGELITPRPAEYVELTLFRIVQEALLNVVKHAQATQAMVVLTSDDTTIYVTISDDGIGIKLTDPKHLSEQQHWGLIAMRERAEAIGGHCQIESYPFLGTAVMVEVQR